MLDREHPAGAPEAGLHLVDDEDDAVLVADPPDPREELPRRDDEAALPLHGLDHDGGDALGGDLCHEGPLERGEGLGGRGPAVVVGEGDAVHLGRERAEPRLVRVRLRRHGHREERAAVEGSLERDHRRAAGVRARELDRVLDRLRARVEERRLRRAPERRDLDQPLGQLDVDLVRDDREVGVGEARRLLLHRLDDSRMGVADVQAADAAGEVDEGVAVDVGDRRAPPLRDDDREVDGQRIRHDAVLAGEDLLGARTGDRRPELDRPRRRHRADSSEAGGALNTRIAGIQPTPKAPRV